MSDIVFVDKAIEMVIVRKAAEQRFGDMVKAVVDIEKNLMAIGGELHADEEAFLLDRNCEQKNLWGINIYPDIQMPDAIEFDSMINIRPSQDNPSREVQSKEIRKRILETIKILVPDLQ